MGADNSNKKHCHYDHVVIIFFTRKFCERAKNEATILSYLHFIMHISNSYTAATPVPGNLSLPALQQKPTRPYHREFAEEVNGAGVYIHKLSRGSDSIKEQFDKIEKNEIPTPGTFVGVGLHRTYNHFRWLNTSGLVFSPDTVSLLSYKGDIASVRLTNSRKNFSHFTDGDLAKRHADYAQYLSDTFNKLDATKTAFNNRKPKQLRLVGDVSFAKAKCRELELRSNLAFRKPDDEVPGKFSDTSSKHLISQILQPLNRPADFWTKSTLLAELGWKAARDKELAPLIEHAMIKIGRFNDDDAVIRDYLRRGAKKPTKKDHYISTVRTSGAQTPNEHLLLPTLRNIVGVCVNIETVEGIDQALAINAALRERQAAAGIADHDNPALIYHISLKKNGSIIHIGWSRHVIPWSSEGLKEFAKTGLVTGIDGGRFTPDHMNLIDKLADAGGLVCFDAKKIVNNCAMPKNFVDDLSEIKENGANLLHLAIQNGRDVDSIKFLYFWKVNAFSEKNAAGKTALALAFDTGHPGYGFLREAESWNGDDKLIAIHRNDYIKGRLAKLRNGPATYELRSGMTEKGQVSFVPELWAYRVTNGESWLDLDSENLYRGIRKYDAALGDMALSVGSCAKSDSKTEVGLWDLSNPPQSYRQHLRVGFVHWAEQVARIATLASPESIHLISRVEHCNANIRLKIERATLRFFTAEIEGGLSSSAGAGNINPACCGYFKARLFVPKETIEAFRRLSAKHQFAHLRVIDKSFDRTLPDEARQLILCKYTLANVRYLKAWKNSIAALSPEELAYVEEKSSQFVTDTDTTLIEQREVLHRILENHIPLLAAELGKPDKDGQCLLHEIAKEYLHSDDPLYAKVQYMLGKQLESRNKDAGKDIEIARRLYENSARHSFGEAEYALSRFFERGLGGLTKDHNKALALIQLAAGKNVPEAKDALSRLHSKSLSKIVHKVGSLFRRN